MHFDNFAGMKRYILFLLLSLAPLCVRAKAASPYFLKINRDDTGLSHNGIRAILQDSRGYIWIGTQMGLNRWDGRRIKIFPNDLLPSAYIFTLGEDKHGNIWIGTGNGIAFYNYEEDRIERPCLQDGSCIDAAIYSITCNTKGEVWFDARMDVLFSYDYRDGYIRKRDIGFKHPTIKRIKFSPSDALVICSHLDNIYIYTPDDDTLEPLKLDQGGELIQNEEIFGPEFNGRYRSIFYIESKSHGLVEVNLKTKSARVLFRWDSLQKPTQLVLYDNHYLLASTTSGLIWYNLATSEKVTWKMSEKMAHSLSENFIQCAIVDRNGGIWAGTAQYGVCYTSPDFDCFRRIDCTTDGVSLAGCNTRGVCEDKNGTIWVCTEKLGLLKYDTDSDQLRKVSAPGIPAFLTAILADDDDLWIGTQYGIIRYSPLTGRVKKYDFKSQTSFSQDNRVISVFKSSSNQIYVSASAMTLVYDADKDCFQAIPSVGLSAYESMSEDTEGVIWLGAYSRGLHSMDPHNDYAHTFWPQCERSMISTVITDNAGDIWAIGYGPILSRYHHDTGLFESYTPENTSNLPVSSYVSARFDQRNHLWIGTTSGLLDFDVDKRECVTYTAKNGLLDNCFSKASVRLMSGKMVFGSLDGLVMFSPESVGQTRIPGKVDIVSLRINDESFTQGGNVNDLREIKLGPRQNSISLDFATPGSSFAMDLTCMLEGYDQAERLLSQDMSVSYYGLSPGKYILHLTGHPDLAIKIAPFFWQSSYGIIIIMFSILALLSLLGYAILYWQHREQRIQMLTYDREKEKSVLNDKMKFMSNIVHEIKTPLTLIKSPLNSLNASPSISGDDRRNLEIIENGTEYLDKLAKELLRFITVSEFNYILHLEPIDLIESISAKCHNYSETIKERGIRLIIDNDGVPVQVSADRAALNKILNNLLDNALKYTSSYIEIRITRSEDGKNALLFIRNDGKTVPVSKREEIFKPFVTISSSTNELPDTSFGLGLPFARRLSELMGGSLVMTAEKEAEFLLSLPLFESEDPQGAAVPSQDEQGKIPVLILEDNPYLRNFLTEKLGALYAVIEADNVASAFEILAKTAVSLALVDLNLPGTNGLDFIRKVKMNPALVHISIIVISATSSERVKVECLNSGARLYIEKPFTLEYLIASIRGVLSNQGDKGPAAEDSLRVKIEDKDAAFLGKLDDIVMAHLDDETFGVSQLEEALFVSHATLNRRMAALLQTSPVEYIRTRRLNAAMELIKNKAGNLSEIAYATGFSSLSYFSRCFKDYFGKSPAAFVKQNEN